MTETNSIARCPDIELLELCLETPPNHSDRDELLEHIADCPQCRTTLEWLAGEPTWWQRSQAALASTLYEDHRHSPTLHIAGSICPLSDQVAASQNAPQQLVEHEIETLQRLLEPATHPELLGRLGRYELEELVGRGGMGLVFRAFDTDLHRVVAIKTLAIHLVPIESARERFVRESRACASLLHSHIVPIYDVVHDTPVPALVMQYVPGPSLDQWLEQHGAMEWRQALSLLSQLADALSAAHAEGLIHRDIKPGNVLVEADATRALLADFGLVRTLDDASLTHSGMLAGTPDYMSPEQAKGEHATELSDLFSLGALAFTMLTGQPPFRAPEPFAVINQVIHKPHEFPLSVQNRVPSQLLVLVNRLLEKDPEDRFTSSAELYEALSTLKRLDHAGELTVGPLSISKLPNRSALKSVPSARSLLKFGRIAAGIGILCVIAWGLSDGWQSQYKQRDLPSGSLDPSKEIESNGNLGSRSPTQSESSSVASDSNPNSTNLSRSELTEMTAFVLTGQSIDSKLRKLRSKIDSSDIKTRPTEDSSDGNATSRSSWRRDQRESTLQNIRQKLQNLKGNS
ncbi:MAG: serine/threonine-protein kinase [Pirellulaceae bacterium]